MSCRTRAAIAIIRDSLSRFMVLSSHCDAVLISAGFLTLNFGYCKVSERYHEPLTSIWRKPTEKSRAFSKNLPAGFFPHLVPLVMGGANTRQAMNLRYIIIKERLSWKYPQ